MTHDVTKGRTLAGAAAVFLSLMCASGAAQAQSSSAAPASSAFCDRARPLSARQQDHLLRLSAAAQEELDAMGGGVALISRSGLDLARFRIRYSHAGLAWHDGDRDAWTVRQLYYACEQSRPLIYDQGLAGFASGIDDAGLAYLSIVRLPQDAGASLRSALLAPQALSLLGATYSANAYPFSTSYQNCNQWLMEVLALAWGELQGGEDLRARAQQWLRDADYAPTPVELGSRTVLMASWFMPLLHLDDHPRADRSALKLKVSLPSTVEDFVRRRLPESERVELCHNGRQIVIHRGWTPIAAGCVAGEGDRVVALD